MNEVEQPVEVQVEALRSQIKSAASRVKELGEWPDHVQEDSLVARVPEMGKDNAPGFDAGIACALDVIKADKQKLAATLHANYTPEAVQQVRSEVEDMSPDSETCWWLAACSICEEGGIDQDGFLNQLKAFKELSEDPTRRVEAARSEYEKMISKFHFEDDLGEDVPYGTEDGCMQGAYIEGHDFAVQWAENYGIYFIGTHEESLGLEDFQWSDEKDEDDRDKSGPVWGSKQFVKCANREELVKALELVKSKFKSKESEEK